MGNGHCELTLTHPTPGQQVHATTPTTPRTDGERGLAALGLQRNVQKSLTALFDQPAHWFEFSRSSQYCPSVTSFCERDCAGVGGVRVDVGACAAVDGTTGFRSMTVLCAVTTCATKGPAESAPSSSCSCTVSRLTNVRVPAISVAQCSRAEQAWCVCVCVCVRDSFMNCRHRFYKISLQVQGSRCQVRSLKSLTEVGQCGWFELIRRARIAVRTLILHLTLVAVDQ